MYEANICAPLITNCSLLNYALVYLIEMQCPILVEAALAIAGTNAPCRETEARFISIKHSGFLFLYLVYFLKFNFVDGHPSKILLDPGFSRFRIIV